MVVKVHGVVIRGTAVSDKGVRGRRGIWWSESVVKRGYSRLRTARLREIVAADGSSFLFHNQPGVVPLAVDLNVGFVGRRHCFRHGHVLVHPRRQQFRRGVDVIDHRLVRDVNVEESGQQVARLPGAQSNIDETAEHQGQGPRRVVNAREVDVGAALGTSADQILGFEMKFAELITQLVVGIIWVPLPGFAFLRR